MLRYILRRLLLLIPLLLAASAIIAAAAARRQRPGAGLFTPVEPPPTEEMVASTRELPGLNQPLAMQYLHWLWRALHLVRSLAPQRPVLDDLLRPAGHPCCSPAQRWR
ncbi:hypothetical protein MJ575_27815 [Klebsiella pneumoniae]|nr:hypothetical protein MJ575_27815 [Klebsiella pneumoniae]